MGAQGAGRVRPVERQDGGNRRHHAGSQRRYAQSSCVGTPGRAIKSFSPDLAKASGIETPTREDLRENRQEAEKKASNEDWENPNDPDAKITKMKDGTTHLAHKQEHAVDMDSGAVLAVTIQPADEGDTTTWRDDARRSLPEPQCGQRRSALSPKNCTRSRQRKWWPTRDITRTRR